MNIIKNRDFYKHEKILILYKTLIYSIKVHFSDLKYLIYVDFVKIYSSIFLGKIKKL